MGIWQPAACDFSASIPIWENVSIQALYELKLAIVFLRRLQKGFNPGSIRPTG